MLLKSKRIADLMCGVLHTGFPNKFPMMTELLDLL